MLQILKKSYPRAFVLVFVLLIGHTAVSYAQEDEVVTEAPLEAEAPKEDAKLQPGPKLQELEAYTAGLLKGLEPYQARYIYQIRQEFGIIRSVQVVRSDIEKAVESCATENPDMDTQMNARFTAWKDQILPKLAVADVALKDAIQRQGFRPTVRVNMLLDHVQAAFEERDANIKKVPITTAKACESLLDSLDRTEENLKALLDKTSTALNEMSITPEESAAVPSNDESVGAAN